MLGGTTEASLLAKGLADARIDAVFSYAGRTAVPVTQPLPQRIGGFGGVDGLTKWLRDEKITHVIDATHPFAAQMSRHAFEACAALHLPLAALERPPWPVEPGWSEVQDIDHAAQSLPQQPARVFLAIGRQHVGVFASAPQHHYLLRLIDEPAAPLLPCSTTVIARGPFDVAGDLALLRDNGIDIVVTKNSGGIGAEAKLTAARTLDLPVIMVARPALPPRPSFASVAQILQWLDHGTDLGV